VGKWCNSSDFINANMIELKQTGFMSNRGRQNVASYFCNELNMDWRLGAAYFESQLIDYDVCSNWGNWAYLAGVEMIQEAPLFQYSKQANDYDKDRSSVICGCSSFLSRKESLSFLNYLNSLS
jgi:deoxyribodipyrimidine photo-lyase